MVLHCSLYALIGLAQRSAVCTVHITYKPPNYTAHVNVCRGTVASWLVCSTLDQAVWFRALAGDFVLCSWARMLGVTGNGPASHLGGLEILLVVVPLSTQVYKWVSANLMLGVTLQWTSIPSRGNRNAPSCFSIRSSLMGHLAHMPADHYLFYVY